MIIGSRSCWPTKLSVEDRRDRLSTAARTRYLREIAGRKMTMPFRKWTCRRNVDFKWYYGRRSVKEDSAVSEENVVVEVET